MTKNRDQKDHDEPTLLDKISKTNFRWISTSSTGKRKGQRRRGRPKLLFIYVSRQLRCECAILYRRRLSHSIPMLNGGIVPVNANSSCTARSVEDGSRWTGVGDKEVVDTYEAFAPTGHDREKSRCSSQRAATSSREMVMEDPEQSTDGFCGERERADEIDQE